MKQKTNAQFTEDLMIDLRRRLEGLPYTLEQSPDDMIRVRKVESVLPATPIASIQTERGVVSIFVSHGGARYIDDHAILTRELRSAITPNFRII